MAKTLLPSNLAGSKLLPSRLAGAMKQRAPVTSNVAYKFPASYPIHVTATTTLTANSSGGVDAVALKNPMGQPMEIFEIRWHLYQSDNPLANLGGVIACKLDLGQFSLTNGFVPIWGFGRPENVGQENITTNPGTIGVTPWAGGFTYGTLNEYVWKLPYPLYVPAGGAVVPTFQHRGIVNGSIEVRISYAARSLPPTAPPPVNLALPYAAAYYATAFNVNDAGLTNSVQTDLVNANEEPVILQRASGRVMLANQNDSPVTVTEASEYAETVAAYTYLVRIVDSFGRPIIQNLTPFRECFSAVTRSWEMDGSVMDPHSFWTAYVQKRVPFQGNASYTIMSQAIICIVGHRVVVGGK